MDTALYTQLVAKVGELTRHEFGSMRCLALSLCELLEDSNLLPLVAERLDDEDIDVVHDALKILDRAEYPNLKAFLRERFSSDIDEELFSPLIEALYRQPTPADLDFLQRLLCPSLEEREAYFRDEYDFFEEIKLQLFGLLHHQAIQHPSLIGIIQSTLADDPAPDLYPHMLGLLGQQGKAGILQLLELLNESNPFYQSEVIIALCPVLDQETLAKVVDLLELHKLTPGALIALLGCQWGDFPETRRRLIQSLCGHQHREVRKAVLDVICAEYDPFYDRFLTRFIADDDDSIRQTAKLYSAEHFPADFQEKRQLFFDETNTDILCRLLLETQKFDPEQSAQDYHDLLAKLKGKDEDLSIAFRYWPQLSSTHEGAEAIAESLTLYARLSSRVAPVFLANYLPSLPTIEEQHKFLSAALEYELEKIYTVQQETLAKASTTELQIGEDTPEIEQTEASEEREEGTMTSLEAIQQASAQAKKEAQDRAAAQEQEYPEAAHPIVPDRQILIPRFDEAALRLRVLLRQIPADMTAALHQPLMALVQEGNPAFSPLAALCLLESAEKNFRPTFAVWQSIYALAPETEKPLLIMAIAESECLEFSKFVIALLDSESDILCATALRALGVLFKCSNTADESKAILLSMGGIEKIGQVVQQRPHLSIVERSFALLLRLYLMSGGLSDEALQERIYHELHALFYTAEGTFAERLVFQLAEHLENRGVDITALATSFLPLFLATLSDSQAQIKHPIALRCIAALLKHKLLSFASR